MQTSVTNWDVLQKKKVWIWVAFLSYKKSFYNDPQYSREFLSNDKTKRLYLYFMPYLQAIQERQICLMPPRYGDLFDTPWLKISAAAASFWLRAGQSFER